MLSRESKLRKLRFERHLAVTVGNGRMYVEATRATSCNGATSNKQPQATAAPRTTGRTTKPTAPPAPPHRPCVEPYPYCLRKGECADVRRYDLLMRVAARLYEC